MGQVAYGVVLRELVLIVKNNNLSCKPELRAVTKIAEEEADLPVEEASLKTLQDEMAVLTERLEAIKSQGEQAVFRSRFVSCLSTNQSSRSKNWKQLWKLQEEELNRLSEGD